MLQKYIMTENIVISCSPVLSLVSEKEKSSPWSATIANPAVVDILRLTNTAAASDSRPAAMAISLLQSLYWNTEK